METIPECFKQVTIVFMLLMLFYPPKTGIEIITEEPPPDYEPDWDEFGLCPRLTLSEFRKFPGCEHYSDEEALEIIEGLYKLSLIGYNAYLSQKNIGIFISDK